MKSEKYPRAAKRAVRLMTLTLLLVSAFGVVVPQICQAQNPSLAGIWCPACKGYISCPSGKRPAACPNPQCRYSFVQKAKPAASPQFNSGLPRPAFNPGVQRQQPEASDDRLYYDGTVTAGGLQTRHFDPNGLAARAEAWGKEMKQVDTQSRERHATQEQAFENDKNALLKNQGNGTALQQLQNVFSDDAAWNSPLKGKGVSSVNDPNVVDLRASKSLTPLLLRDRERVLDPQGTVPAKEADKLRPGDVLLLRQDGINTLIPMTDNLLAEEKTWDVAHTVIYLKEVNGEKHYLDSQPLEGSRIILQDEFLKNYGSRETQVARLVVPLNEGETKKLYTSAVEMAAENRRNQFGDDYGLFGKSRVCSEADLKLLMDATAGRTAPLSINEKNGNLDINFWPADYLRNPQTFEIKEIPPQFPFLNRQQ